MDKLERELDSLLKEFNVNSALVKSRIFLIMPCIESLDEIYRNHLSNNKLSVENEISCCKIYNKYYHKIISSLNQHH